MGLYMARDECCAGLRGMWRQDQLGWALWSRGAGSAVLLCVLGSPAALRPLSPPFPCHPVPSLL